MEIGGSANWWVFTSGFSGEFHCLCFCFSFYFGVLGFLRIELSPFLVAVIVLGLISSAYQSQILRGAILSLPEGQFKAARAIGMSDPQAIIFIVLPQAMRLALAGLVQRIHDFTERLRRNLRPWRDRDYDPCTPCGRQNIPALLALCTGRFYLYGIDLYRNKSTANVGEKSRYRRVYLAITHIFHESRFGINGMVETDIILDLENISKHYGDQKVLKSVSLSLRTGDIKVIIGGAGGDHPRSAPSRSRKRPLLST